MCPEPVLLNVDIVVFFQIVSSLKRGHSDLPTMVYAGHRVTAAAAAAGSVLLILCSAMLLAAALWQRGRKTLVMAYN